FVVGGPVGDSELLLCHGMVCVVGRMRDLILQLSKSSIYSTKPLHRFKQQLALGHFLVLLRRPDKPVFLLQKPMLRARSQVVIVKPHKLLNLLRSILFSF
ncbi:hypothetical protein ABKV41_14375, partial [Enterobacter roggenkampii]